MLLEVQDMQFLVVHPQQLYTDVNVQKHIE